MTGPIRDVEAELREGEGILNAALAALRGEAPAANERRQRIATLAEQGSTEGERAAARAALGRFDASHREQDNMHRGGNWVDE